MTQRTKEEIVKEINQVVEQNIQPNVAQHGGTVSLEDFDMETGLATMLMSGSCSGCASSTMTLKMGVENMIKHYVREVHTVEAVDGFSTVDPFYSDPFFTNFDRPGFEVEENE